MRNKKPTLSFCLGTLQFALIVGLVFCLLVENIAIAQSKFNESLDILIFEGQFTLPPLGLGRAIQPEGFVVFEDGHFAIVDSKSNKIMVYREGLCISQHGKKGSRLGHFNSPGGMGTMIGGRVILADTGNDRIQILDSSMKAIISVGKKGAGDGELRAPSDVKGGPKDRLYIADTGNKRISIFAAGGEFLARFGSFGDLEEPVALWANKGGKIAVADWGLGRVLLFDHLGRKIYSATPEGRKNYKPSGIFLMDRDYLIASDWENGFIDIFSPEGILLQSIDKAGGLALNCPGYFYYFGEKLYLLDAMNWRILRFAITTNIQEKSLSLFSGSNKYQPLNGGIIQGKKNISSQYTEESGEKDNLLSNSLRLTEMISASDSANEIKKTDILKSIEDETFLEQEDPLWKMEAIWDPEGLMDKEREALGIADPLILFAVDSSILMKKYEWAIRNYAIGLARHFCEKNHISLMLVKENPKIALDFTKDRDKILEALISYVYQGKAINVNEAIDKGKGHLGDEKAHKAMIFFAHSTEEKLAVLPESLDFPVIYLDFGPSESIKALEELKMLGQILVIPVNDPNSISENIEKITVFLEGQGFF